ncbi:MAG: DUF3298 domain-containing protein [Bacillota bacterium]|nr:DUF3298 domain-containing protein [Bacillota bacterium]
MKKAFCLFFICILLFSLSGCGPERSLPDGADTEWTGGSLEEKNPQGGNLQPNRPSQEAEAESVEITESALLPLQLYLGSHYLDEWDENFNVLCAMSWQNLRMGEESAKRFPALYEILQGMDAENAAYYASTMEGLLPQAKEACAANPEYFSGFSMESRYSPQRADSFVLSIMEDSYEYTGGVHPNYGCFCMNFDPASGELLQLEDILLNTESLPQLLAEKIRSKYSFDSFEGLEGQLADYSLIDFNWSLGYQGITFYFNPSEIAAYAVGLLSVTIWFDENPELFQEKYMEVPEGGYARLLPLFTEVEVDLKANDGRRDQLSVFTVEGEYGSKQLQILWNEVEFVEDDYTGFELIPYLVCLGEGAAARYFLYVETVGENGYRSLYMYDLNGEVISMIAELSGAGFPSYHDEEQGIYYYALFNDPSSFLLGTKINILGSMTGTKHYSTNPQSGIAETTADAYDLPEDMPEIISKIPLRVRILPQLQEEELPAGTHFSFLQTDNESYVDMSLPDGRKCRIDFEYKDWTLTINGVPDLDCFEELIYSDSNAG